MEQIRSGNRLLAENLLTRTALTVTTKAGLQLEPVGSPTARYEMGETRYATVKNKLAQVDCQIIEEIDGQETRTDITWLVRKQNLGWRVAGLLVPLTENVPNLLSFENPQDVLQIKAMASGEIIEDVETRQAENSEDQLK